jgi:hypothetical protein
MRTGAIIAVLLIAFGLCKMMIGITLVRGARDRSHDPIYKED